MRNFSKNQLGSLTVLVLSMSQAGLVHAGFVPGPGIQINTDANPALGNCSNPSNTPIANGNSSCSTTLVAAGALTLNGTAVPLTGFAGIEVTGTGTAISTINFSGTVTGDASSVGVNIANTAGHITLNVASGSTIAVNNAATGSAGGAGVIGNGFTLGNAGSITGGAGGNGAPGVMFMPGMYTPGGAGGAGAAGVSGSGFTVNNSGSITGGAGGAGGFSIPIGGSGGVGGAGVSGSGFTVNNSGSITGGTGGSGMFTSATGGAAVISTGGSTVNNSGTITGGSSGFAARANAIDLSGGGNILNLQTGSVINGNIVSDAATSVTGNTAVTGNMNNTGSVSISSGKTLSVSGTFANSGTFTTAVTNSGYGKVSVTGTADITNSVLVVDAASLTGANSYGGILNGVVHSSALTGTFTSFSDNSLLFDFTPVYTATDVNLTIASVAGSGGSGIFNYVAANRNKSAEGAARALDTIINANPGGAIAAVFIPVTTSEGASNAASQTVPLMAGAISQSVSANLNSINHIVQARQEGQYGKSSGDSFYGDKNFWFKPFGSWADQDNRNGVSGYKADSYGMIFGIDATLSDVNRVGLAFAYSRTDVDSKGVARQNADIDSYTAIAYGSHSLNDTTELNFQGDIGFHDTDGTRNIDIGGTNSRADSSYNSWSGHVGAGLAHTMTLTEQTTFTPSIRADYSYIRSNNYSENGAGVLNLNVDKDTNKAFVLGVDGKISHALNAKVSLVANLGFGYDFINDQASLTSAFAGAPSVAFTTKGIDPSPWLSRGGFGVVGKISDTTEISARYDFEVRDNFDNQTASVKVRWLF